MDSSITVLPDSRLKTVLTPKGSVNRGIAGRDVPIFCISCGAFGGWVTEEAVTCVSYLCDDGCMEKYGSIPGTVMIPDRVFFQILAEAQMEHYGRYLTESELVNELARPDSVISKLASQRKLLTPKPGE